MRLVPTVSPILPTNPMNQSPLPPMPPSPVPGWICAAFILVAGVLLGMVGASGNVVLVGLSVGLLAGTFLLSVPVFTLLLVITVGMVSGVIVSIGGGMSSKLVWVVVLMSFLLVLPSALAMIDKPRLPVFVWIFVAFVAVALLSSVMQWQSAGQLASGFKRYFGAMGVMFALVALPLTVSDKTKIRKLIGVLALLQLPFVLWEYFFLVPLRAAFAKGEASIVVVPIDVVAGTFGANLRGGSPNAEMATFVLLVATFIFLEWKHGLLSLKRMLFGILLALPCLMLGEVKILILLFPLAALIIYRRDMARQPGKYLAMFGVIAALTLIVGLIQLTMIAPGNWQRNLTEAIEYNFGHRGYGTLALNRLTVLSFWLQQQSLNDPLGFLFGHGLGSSFKSYEPGVFDGYLAVQYPGYGIGLTTASTLLWDTGIVGFSLFMAVFICAWVEASAAYRRTGDPRVKVMLIWGQVAIGLFILHIPYGASMFNVFPFQLVVAIVLGSVGRTLIDRQDGSVHSDPACRAIH